MSLPLSAPGESEKRDRAWAFAAEDATVTEYTAAALKLTAFNITRPGLVGMFTVLSSEAGEVGHPAHAYFTERYAQVAGHSSEVYRRGIASGEIRPDIDPVAVSHEIMAVVGGLQIQWSLNPAHFDMVGLLRAYLDRLLRGMTTVGTGLPAA